MNNEIKEILRIAKEYDYIDTNYEETKALLDYITNLQEKEHKANNRFNSIKGSCKKLGAKVENQREELKQLNKRLTNLQEENENLKDFNNKLQATKDRLDKYDRENQLKIDKAIGYANSNMERLGVWNHLVKKMIKILQGEDKE